MSRNIIQLVGGAALMASALMEIFEDLDLGIGIEHGAFVFGVAHVVIAASDVVEGYKTARDE